MRSQQVNEFHLLSLSFSFSFFLSLARSLAIQAEHSAATPTQKGTSVRSARAGARRMERNSSEPQLPSLESAPSSDHLRLDAGEQELEDKSKSTGDCSGLLHPEVTKSKLRIRSQDSISIRGVSGSQLAPSSPALQLASSPNSPSSRARPARPTRPTRSLSSTDFLAHRLI